MKEQHVHYQEQKKIMRKRKEKKKEKGGRKNIYRWHGTIPRRCATNVHVMCSMCGNRAESGSDMHMVVIRMKKKEKKKRNGTLQVHNM